MADNGHTTNQIAMLGNLITQYGSVAQIPYPRLLDIGFAGPSDAQTTIGASISKPIASTIGGDHTWSVEEIMGLVKKYGWPGNIPDSEIAKTGWSRESIGYAYNYMQTPVTNNDRLNMVQGLNVSQANVEKNKTLAPWYTPPEIGNPDLAPQPGGANYGTPAGGYLDVTKNTLSGAFDSVPTTPEIAAAKDDYAAQYGPGGSAVAPGSSNVNPDPTGTIGSSLVAPSYADFMNGYKDPQFAAYPTAPAPYDFEMHDFTNKATQQASQAYSPAFQAIEEAKTQAQNNYNVADTVVKGIYGDLVKNIATTYNNLDAEHVAQAADQQKATQEAAANLSAVYRAGNVPGNPNAADQLAFQQGQLSNQGLEAVGNINSDRSAESDYGASMGTAANTQGAFARQNLAFNLADTLSNWDQNKLNLSTDEANRVLDLANTLSGQDMSLQQLQAGQQQQAYQNAFQNVDAGNKQLAQESDADYRRRQDAWQAAIGGYQFDKDFTEKQREFDTNTAIKQTEDLTQNSQFGDELQTRLAIAAIGAQSSSDSSGNPLPWNQQSPQTRWWTYFQQDLQRTGQPIDAGQVKSYLDIVTLVQQKYITQGTTQGINYQQFVKEATDAAQAQGLDPEMAANAARDWLESGAAAGVINAAGSSSN